MGFFKQFFELREIEKAEKAVAKDPSAANRRALVEVYIAHGSFDKALATAKDAARKFPEDAAIQKAAADLKTEHQRREIDALENEIRANPNPTAYARLGEYYREAGKENRALEICEEGIARFPEQGHCHPVAGQIYLDRFHRELWEKDLRQAVYHLEKSLRFNPHNYKSLLLLAETYLASNLPHLAIPRLEQVLNFAPEDASAKKLLAEAKSKLPKDQQAELAAKAAEEHVHVARRETKGHPKPPAPPATPAEWVERLAPFGAMKGFVGALVLDENGQIFASRGTPGLGDPAFAAAAVSALSQRAAESAARMDIGVFEEGLLDGADKRALVLSHEGKTLAVLATREATDALLAAAAERFAETLK